MEKENKINILVLEDDPSRIVSFQNRFSEMSSGGKICHAEYVDTAQECIEKLSSKKYDIIFLDHDLGGEVYVDEQNKNTGSEVARWLSVNKEQFQKGTPVIVHSLNPAGRANMLNLINNSYEAPFVWTEDIFKKVIGYK